MNEVDDRAASNPMIGAAHHPCENTVPPAWCVCGKCRDKIASERVCCNQAGCVLMIDKNLAAIVLNRDALRTAVNASRLRLCEREWDYSNDTMRHTAYKQYVYFAIGHTGKGKRICPPNCVLWRIRDMYPSVEPYVGFKNK